VDVEGVGREDPNDPTIREDFAACGVSSFAVIDPESIIGTGVEFIIPLVRSDPIDVAEEEMTFDVSDGPEDEENSLDCPVLPHIGVEAEREDEDEEEEEEEEGVEAGVEKSDDEEGTEAANVKHVDEEDDEDASESNVKDDEEEEEEEEGRVSFCCFCCSRRC